MYFYENKIVSIFRDGLASSVAAKVNENLLQIDVCIIFCSSSSLLSTATICEHTIEDGVSLEPWGFTWLLITTNE